MFLQYVALYNIVFFFLAPSPKVEGSLTELVGNTLTLQCQYDDVLPLGTLSLFFFNGTTIQVAKVYCGYYVKEKKT